MQSNRQNASSAIRALCLGGEGSLQITSGAGPAWVAYSSGSPPRQPSPESFTPVDIERSLVNGTLQALLAEAGSGPLRRRRPPKAVPF